MRPDFSRPVSLLGVYLTSCILGYLMLPYVWGNLGGLLREQLIGSTPTQAVQIAFFYGLIVRGPHVFLAASVAALVCFWMRRSPGPALAVATLPLWAPGFYFLFYMGFVALR